MILDVLARHVATRGTHPFLRHEGRSVSYAEFDRLANRAAHALRGARRRARRSRDARRAATRSTTSSRRSACSRPGGVLNPVNPGARRGGARLHPRPRRAARGGDRRGAATEQAAVARRAHGAAPGGLSAMRSGDARPTSTLGRDDASTLLYTSGTTGRPKGVVFTHGRSGTSGPHFIAALGLDARRRRSSPSRRSSTATPGARW